MATAELRAFRGTRRASVYRDHALPAHDLARIADAARRGGLAVLASLDAPAPGPHELDKSQARDAAHEATTVRLTGELLDLDDQLMAIADLCRWCARAPGEAWL